MDYDDRMHRMQERIARQQERWARRQERWARRQERWARRPHTWGNRSPAHGIVFSVALIAIGALFLLDNLGIFSFHDAARYWPVILIALGVVRLVDSHGTASIVWGGLLTGIGTLLLLDNLNIIYFDWRLFWPAILIGLGVLMLIRNTQDPRRWMRAGGVAGAGTSPPSQDPGTLNLWALFSGGEKRITAQDFRGGQISATFGGFEVDLRGAAMAATEATIDVSALFGGVDIQIPETWLAEVRGTALFGGFSDETIPPRDTQTAAPPRLIVTGYAMFGGVTVSN
jgi:predicted membrane protein